MGTKIKLGKYYSLYFMECCDSKRHGLGAARKFYSQSNLAYEMYGWAKCSELPPQTNKRREKWIEC